MNFIDEYVKDEPTNPLEIVDDEVIGVELMEDLEATPFLPDGTESIIMIPGWLLDIFCCEQNNKQNNVALYSTQIFFFIM